jgi:hypothetical protein
MWDEFLLPFEIFVNLFKELAKMNEGKRGRPYEFPQPFIEL